MRKSVSAPLGAKKTSREMKQNAFRFHAQASVIMTLVQYNLQSNYGFQPLNRASLLCTGAVKNEKHFFPKCFTLCYKLCGWVVQSSFFQNVCYLEVSDLGSMEHFVDLDQENASVWSPSPETNLTKYRHPCARLASGGAARRQTRVAHPTPGSCPPPATRLRAQE